jgi:hypothetical protein
MARELDDDPAEDLREWTPEINQTGTRAGLIGEYIGIACWDGFATAVWTDTRHGNQDTYGGVQEISQSVGETIADGRVARIELGPNPADGPIGIRYQVPTDGWVTLEVFDVGGRRVRSLVDRKIRSGEQFFVWDGTDQVGRRVAPGSYFVRYRAPGVEESASIRIQH